MSSELNATVTMSYAINHGLLVLQVTPEKQVHAVSKKEGYRVLEAKSIVLAMGCRERTRGAISTTATSAPTAR